MSEILDKPLVKLKFRANLKAGFAFKSDLFSDVGIPVIRIGDVLANGTVDLDGAKKISRELFESHQDVLIKNGDYLMAMTGATIGKVARYNSSEPALLNQRVCRFRAGKEIDPEYLWYLLNSNEYIEYINLTAFGGAQPNISDVSLKEFSYVEPDIKRQKEIVNFLNLKINKIDELIEKQNILVTLLQEKRLATIRIAITKGIQNGAKLKETNIDWIGPIPKHWEVMQLKWITPIKRGASPRPIDDPAYFDDDGEYAWVRISDVTSSDVFLEETEQKLSELGASLSVKLDPGKLFLSIAGSVGKPCITKIKACIHDGFVYFPKYTGNNLWLYYIFESKLPFGGLGKMGTQLNLNTDTVGSIYVPMPPKNEIEDIIFHIENKLSLFNQLIQKTEQSIALLKEHRSSLISAAVTGKIHPEE